jgi:hypothetical protein
VNVQGDRYGEAFAINLGVQPISIPDVLGNAVDPRRILEMSCEFRRRLSENGEDQWWRHDRTLSGVESAFAGAAEVYRLHADSLFDRLCAPGAAIDSFTSADLSSGAAKLAGFAGTPVRMALVFARLRRAHGRITESMAFAQRGLELLGDRVGWLRDRLVELAGA